MKRRIAIVLLLLFLGAVVNVAVAWGCVLWCPAVFEWGETDDSLIVEWTTLMGTPAPNRDRHCIRLHNGFGFHNVALDEDIYLASGAWPRKIVAVTRSGFPMLALEGGSARYSDQHYSRRAPAWIGPRFPPQRDIPLRPLALGFIINTLFYALLLWLILIVPFAARRMLRRRRGQCEKCAYPIGTWGGSPVCTECGAAVRRLVARSS